MEIIDASQAGQAMRGLELRARPDPGRSGSRVRRRFTVSGLVQGVGFRPFAYVTAEALGLAGSVANTAGGVVAEVEGDPEAVREYGRRLRAQAPPLAVVTGVHETDLPVRGQAGFAIAASDGGGAARTLAAPDIAVCADCLREMRDPADRRYRHPFIGCTNCGPRFTIITGLPYDRPATTMAAFPMCAACRAEYQDPRNRRFHAQPIACPDCGPVVSLVDAAGTPVRGDPVRSARAMLAAGRIVAVKGLGGYHLACDARNDTAVALLRRRKRRGDKPFAVMVADLDAARSLTTVGDGDAELLAGFRRPIVLLPRRAGGTIAPQVAPDAPDLGVMLPYTPLHVLLLGLPGDPPGPDALVMTSGNVAGETLVTDDAEALTRLAALADAWLRHDRVIRVPCDDSVSRHVAGAELPVRRSRGYAPLPLALPFEVPPMLAVGADLKNTCAVAGGRYAWVSQHLGDMDDLSTLDALTRAVAHLQLLTGVRPRTLVADRHPEYRSGQWAARHADGRPVLRVQHHHAHIAAVMAEHGLGRDERVIGVAFDGTGYGPDQTVWGGEVLVAGYRSYRRAAHLGHVPLAGGDASVRRPYRMALAHLRAAGLAWDPALPAVAACPPAERALLDRQFGSGWGCVPTSSMGRLFDAVSSLSGVRHTAGYEAEAAMVLEGSARAAWPAPGAPYRFALPPGAAPVVADPTPVVRAVVADIRRGVPPPVVAARFHAAVAVLIADLADRCREQTGLGTVALGGGVFQNALLIEAAQRALRDRGFTVLRPRLLPPNDGGIALGQLMVGACSA
ncbi:carbamoyltransferase HypF [Mangrovihabitans endophyticus]|uniref:Carbamoyltransferase n=1 Tax=Mangrovihabitans endophyticus TaxID=1751298 RepID=A0A8J3BXK6_9ACTN|nr:carbamoyltransferase HypF [Mangrovihabitans endophyticus]GGK76917.1 carbamoyltransferase [Mangrovihabitans endophyticus]